jgi:hypothetical protein
MTMIAARRVLRAMLRRISGDPPGFWLTFIIACGTAVNELLNEVRRRWAF